MDTFITDTCKASFSAYHSIRRMRNSLDHSSTKLLVHSFILTRVDYCICLLVALPNKTLIRLQRVINAAARLIMSTPRFTSITPVLNDLGWLKVSSRIEHRILMIAHQVSHHGAPRYLKTLLQSYKPPRSLRSADNNLLSVTHSRTLMGQRAFSYAVPPLWNNLPNELRLLVNKHEFYSKLQHHLLIIQKQ
jgi:hypothetical protein